MSIEKFFETIEAVSGVKKPSLHLPYHVAWWAMWVTKLVAANVFGNHDTTVCLLQALLLGEGMGILGCGSCCYTREGMDIPSLSA